MSKAYRLDGIDLKNGAKAITMVCVPDGYKKAAPANLIVFLHGTEQTSAEDYLKQSDHKLGEELDKSASPNQVILIVPTLSTNSRGGILGGTDADDVPSDGLQQFLPAVSAALQKLNPDPGIADFGDAGKVGKLILAAHSGGGKVMLALARSKGTDKYADKLAECWGFDCMYGHPAGSPLANSSPVPDAGADSGAWATWETKHRAHREMLWADWLAGSGVPFFLYCATGKQGGGTNTRSTNLDKLAKRRSISSVQVVYDASASHDGIVRPRFAERLAALKL